MIFSLELNMFFYFHEHGYSIYIKVLCICEARRQEHSNYEVGRTKQQEFSLKVGTERERTWRRLVGFCLGPA